jgi:hypothetical protein
MITFPKSATQAITPSASTGPSPGPAAAKPVLTVELPPAAPSEPGPSAATSTGPSWVSELVAATPKKAPFSIQHGRIGSWPKVEASGLARPAAPGGVVPANLRLAEGQAVSAQLGDQTVKGQLLGFDYRGRAVIDVDGDRRIAPFEAITAEGPLLPRPSPLDGLSPGAITRAPAKLTAALDAALDLEVTGKHTAREYVDALHAAGYDVYVVGGAIRDALHMVADDPATSQASILDALKDVDIVTTAPPPVIRALAQAIAPEYEGGAVWSPPTVDQFGAVLIGGPKAGLPNPEGLDVVSIRVSGQNTEPVLHPDTGEKVFPYTFGRSLIDDTAGRDFACNAVYYDPLNRVLIDPTEQGIADAQHKFLRVARETGLEEDANIPLRFLKFRMRGYTTDRKNLKTMRFLANKSLWGPRWRAVMNLARIAPKDAHTKAEIGELFQKLGAVMTLDGLGPLFEKRVAPLEADVQKRIEKRFKKTAEAS